MVTRREKMRNRFLESKRGIFLHQTAILRSQNGRKLNARDYQSVINAHRQSTSVYDNPEAVVRMARHADTEAAAADEYDTDAEKSLSISTAADHIKRPRMAGRPRVKGHRPAQPGSSSSAKAALQKRSLPSAENPYAKPTYRSFEWLLPSRRRSSAGTDDALSVERKRRRKLFGSCASSSAGEVSVAVDEDRMNSCSADFGSGGLLMDVTGRDAAPSLEPSISKSPKSSVVKDRSSDRVESQQIFPGSVSPHQDKYTVSINGAVIASDNLVSPATEPSSSTPLKRSPLHFFEESVTSNHVLTTPQSSPQFNLSKLQARHFSDILVDHMSPSDKSRNRTVSQNSEDTYIDVVSDSPSPGDSVNNQPRVCNGFAEGLSRLSKVKTKKRLTAGGLVNGLRQRTLDSFVRRVPNSSRCPNGIDSTVENVARTENGNQDLKPSSSPSSVKLKQNSVDRMKGTDGTSNENTSSVEQTLDVDESVVDMESIEGVWRRRTSLRSSMAFMSLLGPDLAEWT